MSRSVRVPVDWLEGLMSELEEYESVLTPMSSLPVCEIASRVQLARLAGYIDTAQSFIGEN